MILDKHTALDVEFYIDVNGKCWFNVDGVCVARIFKSDKITIRDDRKRTFPQTKEVKKDK